MNSDSEFVFVRHYILHITRYALCTMMIWLFLHQIKDDLWFVGVFGILIFIQANYARRA